MATLQDMTPALDEWHLWNRHLRRLVGNAERREAKVKGLRPEESAYGVLRIQTYRYYKQLKKAGLIDDLRAYVIARDPGRWHRHVGVDADWILRLVERSGPNWLTPPRRARIVVEMQFAERCGVGSQWLLSFLYEAGSQKMIKAMFEKGDVPAWTAKYKLASKRCAAPGKRASTAHQDAATPARTRDPRHPANVIKL